MARSAVGLFVTIVVSVVAIGCEEKKSNLAPVASTLASSSLPPTSATVKKFAIDPASKTTIEMEAPKEKIKASATGGGGSLTIDFGNIVNSRGEVKIDLTTLTTSTFPEQEKNTSQTTHARTWLEVADGEKGKLDEAVKTSNRWAVYAIRSIENASATDVSKVTPTKDGGDDVRTVSMTTKGEILVHGRKAERDAEVEVKFRYDPGASAESPKAIWIASKKPFRVVLAEHDVKPRDGLGKIAKESFNLLGTKVAENAEITLDIRAKPQS